MDQWFRTDAKQRCRPRELRRREQIIRLHLKPRLGHIPLAKLAPATIEELFATLNTRSAYHVFRVLRAALNHAVRLDLILANPCDRVSPPKPAEFRPTLWTIEETTRFLAECRRSRPELYPFFLTAVATGARSGELLGLQWRHVDLDADTIRIIQELVREGPGFQFSDPKSARSKRTIRLPQEVTHELRALRRRHVAEKLRRGICAKDGICRDQHCPFWHDHDLVFGQPNGKPGHANNLRGRVMRHICKRAKVPVVRFHDLRHAHGSLLAASGVNLKVITERLGHASEGFTLSKYIQVTDMQEQAANVVSARLLSNQSLINPGAVR